MPTTTDLRELLHERADTASTARPPVEEAIRGARRVRMQRRIGVVAIALAVVAAVAIPTTLGWPSADRQTPVGPPSPPANDRVTSSSGLVWAPTMPGLDFPVGAPLAIPYAFDSVVVVDGSAQHELGGVVRRLIEVPEGLVVLVDIEPTEPKISAPRVRTSVVLLVDDGSKVERTDLDTGYIGSITASPSSIGPTRVVWTWTDVSGEADPKEVRAVDLGSRAPPSRLTLEEPAFVWSFDGRDPILQLDWEVPAFARWNVESGALEPMPDHLSSMIAATPDLQYVIQFDQDTECTSAVAATQPDTPLWKRCDVLIQTLTPDGLIALGPLFTDGRINHTADELALIDVKTGADKGALDLPPSGGAEFGSPPKPSIEWFVESWEPDGSVVVSVMYQGLPGEDPDSNFAPLWHTTVRCSMKTGECERIPDPVETVATRS